MLLQAHRHHHHHKCTPLSLYMQRFITTDLMGGGWQQVYHLQGQIHSREEVMFLWYFSLYAITNQVWVYIYT